MQSGIVAAPGQRGILAVGRPRLQHVHLRRRASTAQPLQRPPQRLLVPYALPHVGPLHLHRAHLPAAMVVHDGPQEQAPSSSPCPDQAPPWPAVRPMAHQPHLLLMVTPGPFHLCPGFVQIRQPALKVQASITSLQGVLQLKLQPSSLPVSDCGPPHHAPHRPQESRLSCLPRSESWLYVSSLRFVLKSRCCPMMHLLCSRLPLRLCRCPLCVYRLHRPVRAALHAAPRRNQERLGALPATLPHTSFCRYAFHSSTGCDMKPSRLEHPTC
jgi:hypothetical protein